MATTTFKYASAGNFKDYFPNLVSLSDNKTPIYNWVTTAVSNKYEAHNTGLVSGLYVDGEELGSAESSAGDVSSSKKWFYDSGEDSVTLYLGTDPNNSVIESGSDWTSLMNNHLYRASMELNNMLDARFPVPIPKSVIYKTGDDAEYDAILIKLTCYIVAVNMLRANGDFEESSTIMQEITNTENTGMVDKLNDGIWKLAFETDSSDKKGDIIEVTNTGSMTCAETYGEWSGKKYDKVQIICTTAGAYGVAKVTVKYSNEDKLFGNTKTDMLITGGLDYVVNNLWVRFEGNSMSENDRWDIEVRNLSQVNTNTGVRSVDAIRNDLPVSRITTRDRTFD